MSSRRPADADDVPLTCASRGGVAPGSRSLAVEGAFQALCLGLGESYLSAFALWLGAGGLGLGLVAALPTAAAAGAQALSRGFGPAARPVARIARAWLAQSLLLGTLGLCALLPGRVAVPALCVTTVLAWGAAGAVVPAWSDLVARLVPARQYGWFFGLRAAAQQVGALVAIGGGGLLLAAFSAHERSTLGFVCLFGLAGVARLAGTATLTVVAAPAPSAHRADGITGTGLMRTSRPFRRLAVYLWILHFGVSVATPFFVPYMLADLGYTYAAVGGMVAVPALVKLATSRLWGRVADRVGPGPLLRRTSWFTAVVPALWLVSPAWWWLLLAQVFSGVTWAAFEVAQASALLKTSRGERRPIAFFNGVDGAMLVVGALLGGLVVQASETFVVSAYLVAVALSAVLRGVAAALLIARLRGIGRLPWPSSRLPLRLWAVRPTRGVSYRPMGGVDDTNRQ